MPLRKIWNSFAFVRRHGALRWIEEAGLRAYDRYYENLLHVDTAGMVRMRDIGIENPDSIDYMPLQYRYIFRAISRIPVEKSESCFLDIGAGMGRAVVAAASLPFAKVYGVELAPALATKAIDNVSRMRFRRAGSVEIVQCDAGSYVIPKEVNIVYLYNPFHGQTLEMVLRAILISYRTRPRELYIIYFNNDHFENLVAGRSDIEKLRQEANWRNTLGIYRIRER